MAASTRSNRNPASASTEVRRYFLSQPADARKALVWIRESIRAAAPEAEEYFSYRMPCFRLDGRPLVWYAAFRNHCSLYPIGDAIRRDHAAALSGYATSKGTVRFPLVKPIPAGLVRRLVRARIREVRAKTVT